jgi:hypothetical protein
VVLPVAVLAWFLVCPWGEGQQDNRNDVNGDQYRSEHDTLLSFAFWLTAARGGAIALLPVLSTIIPAPVVAGRTDLIHTAANNRIVVERGRLLAPGFSHLARRSHARHGVIRGLRYAGVGERRRSAQF